MDFARENERSELTGELIGDTLDDALADDGDAEAEDKIVSQVSRVKQVGGDLGVCAVPTFSASILGTWPEIVSGFRTGRPKDPQVTDEAF